MDEVERDSLHRIADQVAEQGKAVRNQASSATEKLGVWLVVGHIGALALVANICTKDNSVDWGEVVIGPLFFLLGSCFAFLGIYFSALFAAYVSAELTSRSIRMREYIMRVMRCEGFKQTHDMNNDEIVVSYELMEKEAEEIAGALNSPIRYTSWQSTCRYGALAFLITSILCFPSGAIATGFSLIG
ncbi:hypothetical protein [Parvularcula oceani]|uniref:hypothetical protein n=1 Tax=Parvularcula oceani TaxID=1247963 RepID=UPI0012DE33AA|nr:hypothetical protein [Parvularcula oceani]